MATLYQEVIDLTNNNVKNGYIYFPEFCNIIHKKYREEDEQVFYQDMFKVVIELPTPFIKTRRFKYEELEFKTTLRILV